MGNGTTPIFRIVNSHKLASFVNLELKKASAINSSDIGFYIEIEYQTSKHYLLERSDRVIKVSVWGGDNVRHLRVYGI